MKAQSWALGAFIAGSLLLAACNGAGTPSASTVPGQSPQRVKTGQLKMMMEVPTQDKMTSRVPHLKKLYAARKNRGSGKPHFVGLAVTEIDLTLTAWNGAGTPPPGYNTTVYTQPGGYVAPNCQEIYSSGYKCTATFSAPAATDTYNVMAKWCSAPNSDGSCPSAATLVSEGNFTVNVPPGGTGSAQLTLDPVVGQLAWSNYYRFGFNWSNGSTAPTLQNGAYVCASSCYEPLLNDTPSTTYGTAATPTYYDVKLLVEDPAGDLIVPTAGWYSSSSGSGVYNTPLYLTAAGAVDDITVSCSDAHVQMLKFSAANPDPAPVASPDLANGFTNAAYSAINSPLTGQDGTTATNLTGGNVTVAGNNVYAVNFDGGVSTYTTSSLDTCHATDSTTPTHITSPNYYIGFAFGNVAIIDTRNRPRR